MEKLKEKLCYVVFGFADGSARTVYTTLNPVLLEQFGARLRQNFLYDVRLQSYVPFDNEAATVDVYEEKPIWGDEVQNFASKFI